MESTIDIEKLPKTKEKNGYIYKQVKRSDNAAVYEQKIQKECNGDVGKVIGYEVFKIVVGKPYTLIGKSGATKGKIYEYPAMEKFPGNEDFGKTAWSFDTNEMAMRKFVEINK